jgi:CRP-like cAMP-binding protein
MKNFFKETFLFRGVNEKTLDLLLKKNFETCKYKKGEVIYSPEDYDRKIGFIYNGKCAVLRERHGAENVILNVLQRSESFGVLAAFSTEEFPTSVRAMSDCEILFFTKSEIVNLITKSPEISLNLINFLADRIAFLNKRIATFTCSSASSKLASYILSEYARCGTDEITFNCKRAATVINTGRASVYRALDSLSADGAIVYDTKKITIKNIEMIERMLK